MFFALQAASFANGFDLGWKSTRFSLHMVKGNLKYLTGKRVRIAGRLC